MHFLAGGSTGQNIELLNLLLQGNLVHGIIKQGQIVAAHIFPKILCICLLHIQDRTTALVTNQQLWVS